MLHPFPVLQTWIRDKLQLVNGVVDDLHIHEIDRRFEAKTQWIHGVCVLIPYVFAKSLLPAEECRIAIAIPLNTEKNLDLFTIDPSQLDANDLCFTPPSIYVAPIQSNFLEFGPWMNSYNRFRTLDAAPWITGDSRLRFVVVDAVSFENQIRTLWIYSSDHEADESVMPEPNLHTSE